MHQDRRKTLDICKRQEEVFIMGYFNARVGSRVGDKEVDPFGESIINENGERLVDLCAAYHLKLCNTFFEHKSIHRCTWWKADNRSLIDYIISPQEGTITVQDARVFLVQSVGVITICSQEGYFLAGIRGMKSTRLGR